MMSENNRPTQNNIDHVKQDILAELDNFLLEAENVDSGSVSTVETARLRALKELDRLIKQDLSYGEILQKLKTRQETPLSKNLKTSPVKSLNTNPNDFYSSIHVVDLRHDFESRKIKKEGIFKRLFTKKSKEDIEAGPISKPLEDLPLEPVVVSDTNLPTTTVALEPQNIELSILVEEPKLEPGQKINFSFVFKKTAVIAAITLVILLPVQGFIFVGKWQQDKDKLLNYGQSGFLKFKSGIINASSNSYKEADVDFGQAINQFTDAQGILNKYDQKFLNIADKLPVIGDTLKSGENILAISSSLSRAAKIINQKREGPTDLTDYINILNTQLDEIIPLLDDTNDRLDKIVGVPEDIKSQLDELKAELPTVISNLKNLKVITSTLESMLGSSKEQRYLLLFQNNNELRAGGGFIGSYALLDVNKGKILQMEIPKGGTYDLTAGQKKKWRSPQALAIVTYTFNIWDANWWPDFPTSARKISSLFAESSGSSVDGVIAINATVLQKLLEITGPISFPEYNVEINSENVIDVLQAEIEGKKTEANPKTIISDLAPKILEKVFNTTNKSEEMFILLADILQHKDLQLYSNDPNIDKQISSLGWRGEMMATDRDYLWVVSSNIGGGKTDLKINELIEHQAQVETNGEIINTVKVTRTNDGSFDNPFAGIDGANVSYLRFYVPQGSQLISAAGFDDIPDNYFSNNKQFDVDPDLIQEESKLIDNESKTEIFASLDRTVFANWQILKPGETKTVVITYKLPFTLKLGNQLTNDWKKIFLASNRHFDHYSLLAQSQSGQQQSILNSKIIFPDNSKIIWQTAKNDNSVQIQDNIINYNQNFDSDQYFGVVITNK